MPTSYSLSTFPTPLGDLALMSMGKTLHLCEFSDREERIKHHIKKYYDSETIIQGPLPSLFEKAFTAYFEGNINSLDTLDVNPRGTRFQQTVWHALRTIQSGSTTSYGDMAQTLGTSARATGNANSRNPICLVLPCHRVIGADGTLTGYAGGLDRKKWLLRHEGAPVSQTS